MKYGRFKYLCINEWFFFKPVVDQTTDLKDVAVVTGVWHIHSASPCEGGASIDSHRSNLKCWSFRKHFINFVPSYEGLCFAFVFVVQRCWNRLLLSASASSGLQRCAGASSKWLPSSLFLVTSSFARFSVKVQQLLEVRRATVESVHLLTASFGKNNNNNNNNCPVLVLQNLMPTWEKKKDKQISQLALDSTVLRLDTVSRESGSTVQKTLVIHQRCTYC